MAPHLAKPYSLGWNSLGWIVVVAGGSAMGLSFAKDLRGQFEANVPVLGAGMKMLTSDDGSGALGPAALATTGVGLYMVGVIRM